MVIRASSLRFIVVPQHAEQQISLLTRGDEAEPTMVDNQYVRLYVQFSLDKRSTAYALRREDPHGRFNHLDGTGWDQRAICSAHLLFRIST